MRKQLMTKKSLDGSISMWMSSGSPRTSPFFRLLSAPELNCLPCKFWWAFSCHIYYGFILLNWNSSSCCSFLDMQIANNLYLAHCSTTFIFLLALVGVFYPYNRGALFTALVVIYALTSGIAGYIATSFYCQLEGTNWVCVTCIHNTSLDTSTMLRLQI